MSGRDVLEEVETLRSRLRNYDEESGDEPLVTLLERVLDINETVGDSLDALENRIDVLEESI